MGELLEQEMYHLLKLFVFTFYFQAKMPSLEFFSPVDLFQNHIPKWIILHSSWSVSCLSRRLHTGSGERYIGQDEELKLGDLTLILRWKKASDFDIFAWHQDTTKAKAVWGSFIVFNPQVLWLVQTDFIHITSPFSLVLFSCFLMEFS